MAYSRSYRRYRRRPRRYIRRYFRRRFRRFINGSSKSTVRMKTSVEGNFKITSGAHGAVGAASEAIIAFARSNAPANAMSVLNSPLYRTYTNLYDQVKCIGMKVSVSIVDAIGGSDIPSVQIYTSWDRQKLGNEAAPSGTELKNSSTYNVATALNNNVAKITRSLYASDLMEKAIWHDCTLSHHAGADPPDPADPEYWSDPVYAAAASLPIFSPAFYMAIATPTLEAAKQVSVACSVVYYMAFRNPKFGASAGLTVRQDLGARRLVRPDADDGDDLGPPPAQRQAVASASGRALPAAADLDAPPPVLDDASMDDSGRMEDSGRHPHNTFVPDQSQRLN